MMTTDDLVLSKALARFYELLAQTEIFSSTPGRGSNGRAFAAPIISGGCSRKNAREGRSGARYHRFETFEAIAASRD